MDMFLYFHNKKLKNQKSDREAAAERNKTRLSIVTRYKGEDSLEARQLRQRIKNDEDEAERLGRKIKRGGF